MKRRKQENVIPKIVQQVRFKFFIFYCRLKSYCKDSFEWYIIKFSDGLFSDGGYSKWSEYSNCSAKCEDETGFQVRTRVCDSPKPQENGLTCLQQGLGDSSEEIKCNGTIPLQSTYYEEECYTNNTITL